MSLAETRSSVIPRRYIPYGNEDCFEEREDGLYIDFVSRQNDGSFLLYGIGWYEGHRFDLTEAIEECLDYSDDDNKTYVMLATTNDGMYDLTVYIFATEDELACYEGYMHCDIDAFER